MNIKLSGLQRWVRFFLGIQVGTGAGMLWYHWPEASWTLCVLSTLLLFTAALGIRPLDALGSFFSGGGPTASTPDAA